MGRGEWVTEIVPADLQIPRGTKLVYLLFLPCIGQQRCMAPHFTCLTCLEFNTAEKSVPRPTMTMRREDGNDLQRVVSGHHSILAVVSRRPMEMSASPRLLMPAVEARRSDWQERRLYLLPRSAARCVAPSVLSARKCRQTVEPPHPTSAYLIPKRLNCSAFSSPRAGSVVPLPGNSSSATLPPQLTGSTRPSTQVQQKDGLDA